jgi:hypothetical protein
VVDEELTRLPDHYRGVVVLCDLEGTTRKEAARQLGIPEGSVASRLARARRLLAKRLSKRGIVFSGSVAAVSAAGWASSAPPALVASTITAASLLAAGRAAGVVSANVSALTEGVLRTMFLTKVKTAVLVVLVAVSLTGGTGFIYQTQAAQVTTRTEAKEKDPLPVKPAEAGKGDSAPELQRRIGQLEKQVQTLTAEVAALRAKPNAAGAEPPAKTEVKMFQLRNRKVREVNCTILDLYKSRTGKEIRVGVDTPSNTLIVVASPTDLAEIEAIVTKLEELPTKEQNADKAGK